MARERKTLLNRFFLRGIAALLPTLITVFIIYRIAAFVHDNLGEPINNFIAELPGIERATLPPLLGDAVGVLAILLVCMLVGFFLTSFIGRRLYKVIEDSVARLPILRAIYPPIKQLTDFFLSERRRFGRVVSVEYPRKGLRSIGFVTGEAMKDIKFPGDKKLVTVFIPSSPTPMTGYVIILPEDEVQPLDISVDEALRFTISGGVLVPPSQQPLGADTNDIQPEDTGDKPPSQEGDGK